MCQRLCTGQRLWVAPGDAWQAAIALHQVPVPRRPFPFTEKATSRWLKQMPSHVILRQVHAGRVGGLQHKHGAACAKRSTNPEQAQ
jgi:hypothetical protein